MSYMLSRVSGPSSIPHAASPIARCVACARRALASISALLAAAMASLARFFASSAVFRRRARRGDTRRSVAPAASSDASSYYHNAGAAVTCQRSWWTQNPHLLLLLRPSTGRQAVRMSLLDPPRRSAAILDRPAVHPPWRGPQRRRQVRRTPLWPRRARQRREA